MVTTKNHEVSNPPRRKRRAQRCVTERRRPRGQALEAGAACTARAGVPSAPPDLFPARAQGCRGAGVPSAPPDLFPARAQEDKKAYSELVEGVVRDTTPSNQQPHEVYINDSGLYSLVMRSKKEEAKAFKRWVTAGVLPSIRHTGGPRRAAVSVWPVWPVWPFGRGACTFEGPKS